MLYVVCEVCGSANKITELSSFCSSQYSGSKSMHCVGSVVACMPAFMLVPVYNFCLTLSLVLCLTAVWGE